MKRKKGIFVNGEWLGGLVVIDELFRTICNISPAIIKEFILTINALNKSEKEVKIINFQYQSQDAMKIEFKNEDIAGNVQLFFKTVDDKIQIVDKKVTLYQGSGENFQDIQGYNTIYSNNGNSDNIPPTNIQNTNNVNLPPQQNVQPNFAPDNNYPNNYPNNYNNNYNRNYNNANYQENQGFYNNGFQQPNPYNEYGPNYNNQPNYGNNYDGNYGGMPNAPYYPNGAENFNNMGGQFYNPNYMNNNYPDFSGGQGYPDNQHQYQNQNPYTDAAGQYPPNQPYQQMQPNQQFQPNQEDSMPEVIQHNNEEFYYDKSTGNYVNMEGEIADLPNDVKESLKNNARNNNSNFGNNNGNFSQNPMPRGGNNKPINKNDNFANNTKNSHNNNPNFNTQVRNNNQPSSFRQSQNQPFQQGGQNTAQSASGGISQFADMSMLDTLNKNIEKLNEKLDKFKPELLEKIENIINSNGGASSNNYGENINNNTIVNNQFGYGAFPQGGFLPGMDMIDPAIIQQFFQGLTDPNSRLSKFYKGYMFPGAEEDNVPEQKLMTLSEYLDAEKIAMLKKKKKKRSFNIMSSKEKRSNVNELEDGYFVGGSKIYKWGDPIQLSE